MPILGPSDPIARQGGIRAGMDGMERDQAAVADALATVEQFNARLAAGKPGWFWPTIAASRNEAPLVGDRVRQLPDHHST
jgi:hypothetical protein